MKSGDKQEYERRTRQGRLEGMFYLGCVIFAVAMAYALRG